METLERGISATEWEAMTPAQREAELDQMLALAAKERAQEAYTLPQLLGQPQPYEPIEGLYFKRPKIGHKLDIARRHAALIDRQIAGMDELLITDAIIGLVQPYCYMAAEDGSIRSATHDDLKFQVFDDFDQIMDFFNVALMNAKKAEDGQDPNEPALKPS